MFDASGDIGGVSEFLISIAAFFIIPISTMSFKIGSIHRLFKIVPE